MYISPNDFGPIVWLLFSARDESRGHAAVDLLARESEVEPIFHQLDVTQRSSIERLCNFLQDRYGGVDILVNNAGIMHRRNQVTLHSVL